jgi:hypothetical protein
VAAFQAEVLDVRTGGLRYPQPVEGEQGNQRVVSGRAEPGGDQESPGFVAVQGGGVRFVVEPGAADVCGRGMLEEFFLYRVLIEPEGLDVSAA